MRRLKKHYLDNYNITYIKFTVTREHSRVKYGPRGEFYLKINIIALGKKKNKKKTGNDFGSIILTEYDTISHIRTATSLNV